MSADLTRIRYALLYEFDLGHTAAEAHRNITQVMGQDAISDATCRRWFAQFRSGNRELSDLPRSGRPSEIDIPLLRSLVEENPRLTTRELAERLNVSHTTVATNLREMGKVKKLGSWLPHELTIRDRIQRQQVCTILLQKSRRFDWLDHVITGDETWVLYVNHTRKRQWVDVEKRAKPTPKPELHPKKVLMSVWWDVHGVILWELLPTNVTINSVLYCDQLQRLSMKLATHRPQHKKIAILHDNARPHTSKATWEKLMTLGWEVLPHPPYSPDLAPSDYHLFRALKNFLREKSYDDRQHLSGDLEHFFGSRPANFYKDGIHSLPNRWRSVVDSDGAYIDD